MMLANTAVIDRFWSRVTIRRPDECWVWKAYTDRQGYGRFPVAGKLRRAHAIAWELAQGRDWPDSLIARHTCDTPGCVNPAHIVPGTHAENSRDKYARGRARGLAVDNSAKTHCINGHPFSGDNLLVAKSGERRCRECGRRHSLAHFYRKKELEAQQ